jgi:hypothetical protein
MHFIVMQFDTFCNYINGNDATFNNISVISWRSVLMVEETGVPGENHRPDASYWQTLSHNVVHTALSGIRTHNISSLWYEQMLHEI